MEQQHLQGVLEAILYVAGEPVELKDLARALEISDSALLQALDELEYYYDAQYRGLRLKRFGTHVQLGTRAAYAPYIERLLQPVQKVSLSQAALETLAVVAYRQPVTRLDVEMVRGVKCDYSIQSLVTKGLIAEVGRKETIGRPILYATTDLFLNHFGLQTLNDLPKPPEKPAAGEIEQEEFPI
ncbi:MAG: SMC-Scp complex subunit ScpB [Clostridiales bacterium]|jgi:segregation and condensation protein B|nr:SMC-Scp complex subunit ScpB [Clostridiales bacterium]